MPTYDYKCDACGHTFEEWQKFSDEVLTKCPACKKKKLQRLFGGGAAIIFKGSGFYETDYRKDSYKAGEKADKEATAKPAETKADAPASSAGSSTASSDSGSPAPAAKPAAKKGKAKSE